MADETRIVPVEDWAEECKKIHREGLTVRQMERSEAGDMFVVTVRPRVETRDELVGFVGESGLS